MIINNRAEIAPVPRITIQSFSDAPQISLLLKDLMQDRRMFKAHLTTNSGGVHRAVMTYQNEPTPNLIILEVPEHRADFLSALDQLADLCDASTRVVALGRTNEIQLYRALMARGVSEYLVEPFDTVELVRAISGIYAQDTRPMGRIVSVMGAKGGVGASTVAHNLAWAAATDFGLSTSLLDLDLPFGTAGLNYNQDPVQGIADVIAMPDRVDPNMLDRLLTRCHDQLTLLAAPTTLEKAWDLPENAFDMVLDIMRSTVPFTVLDLPHGWQGWTLQALLASEEIVIVAQPDLANLRNAKLVFDKIIPLRPNDDKPKIVLNMVGVPKRPEISANDFARALSVEVSEIIPFDPKAFGFAANNGQMMAQTPEGKLADHFKAIAQMVSRRTVATKRAKTGLLDVLKSGKMKLPFQK